MASSRIELKHPKVVSPAAWLAARKELLKKEKEFSRLRDELGRQRRELPWERVDKAYVFDGPKGKETLTDLCGERRAAGGGFAGPAGADRGFQEADGLAVPLGVVERQ